MTKRAHIVIDTEASGPCIGEGSMIQFGAVLVCPNHRLYWYDSGLIPPYSERYSDGAYESIGMTRAQHIEKTGGPLPVELAMNQLKYAMAGLTSWVAGMGYVGATMWSDNPAFDWQWVNHGYHATGQINPLGFSARRIGDLYAGAKGKGQDATGWKKMRETKHTHHPVDDGRGNVEALLKINSRFGLGLPFLNP